MSGIAIAFRRELKRIFSMKEVLSTIFAAALIYSLYYPQPYVNEALRDIPIALVDLDGTTASRELARRIDASPDVAVAMVLPDLPTAQRQVYERTISGIVVIPRYFERELLHGRASPILQYTDASYFLVNQRVAAGISGTARAFGVEVEEARLIALQVDPPTAAAVTSPLPFTAIPLFNPAGGYATYLLPGAFLLILQQTLLVAVCLLAVTARRTRLEPATGPVATVLGNLLAYLAVEAIVVPIYLIVTPYFYGVPRLGSLADILVAAIPFVLAVSAMGMVIGSLFRSPLAVQLVAAAIGMPFFFLSGFSWPTEAIPPALHAVSMLVPSTFAVTGLTMVAQMGASIAEINLQFLGLWALAIGYVLLAIVLEWRRQRRNQPSAGQISTA